MTADHLGFHRLTEVDQRLWTVLVYLLFEELLMNVVFLKTTRQELPLLPLPLLRTRPLLCAL